MARAPKAPQFITPAEKKEQISNLKELIKKHAEAVKAVTLSGKEAQATLAAAKRDADAVAKKANATVAEAQRAYAAAVLKMDKAKAAATTGTEKLQAKLVAVNEIPTKAAPKVKAVAPE